MSNQKDPLAGLWAAVEEKSCLLNAAGLLLFAPEARERRFLRPVIAAACALALWLMPLVSAGEGMPALGRLVW